MEEGSNLLLNQRTKFEGRHFPEKLKFVGVTKKDTLEDEVLLGRDDGLDRQDRYQEPSPTSCNTKPIIWEAARERVIQIRSARDFSLHVVKPTRT